MTLDLNEFLPSVPDFPKPGIVFRDIAPLLGHPAAFSQAIAQMAALFDTHDFHKIAGIESRGLIFAAAMATRLHKPFLPVRKPGKLPPPVVQARYALEYGSDALEMQCASVKSGDRVLLVDDVIATGGTLAAAAEIVRGLGGQVAGVAALLVIGPLGGVERLAVAGLTARSLLCT
jgi:adenine phosphoribosyltransferase